MHWHPDLIASRINLNPVWVMFAIAAFGYLFGFIGLLIAVPLAAVIGVLVRFATREYLLEPTAAPTHRCRRAGTFPQEDQSLVWRSKTSLSTNMARGVIIANANVCTG